MCAMAYAVSDDDPGYVVRQCEQDPRAGRGLFATRHLLPGQTVFREAPMASCQFAWNRQYGYLACHHCMEPLETAQENVSRLTDNPGILLPNTECCVTRGGFHVACPNCGVKYCSKQCLDEAWHKFHKTLCLGTRNPDPHHPFLVLLDMWRSFHYPPETVSVELIARIFAQITQSSDPEAAAAEYLSFVHGTADGDFKLKLLGEDFVWQLEQIRQGFILLFGSQEESPVAQFLTPEGFGALFALLGRNGQGLATSPFSQWVKNVGKLKLGKDDKMAMDDLIDRIYEDMDSKVGSFLDNEGSGLFRLQSTCNHSCEPNAVVELPFNNYECVVNTTRAVEAGEEIRISYLSECDLQRSRHSRQKILRENYLFECSCPKCNQQINDPDETSEEEDDEEDDMETEAQMASKVP